MYHQRHVQKQEIYLLLVQLSLTSPLHSLIIGRVALANANKPEKVGSSFLVSLPKWANFLFCEPQILNFLSEHNIAIPSSRRKLAIKFMLGPLPELKQLGASIPAPSLSSASSASLTFKLAKNISHSQNPD